LVGFVVLSNVYYASAASEQVSSEQRCFDNFTLNMEPSLSLVVRNSNPIINKGDTINFEIYISGFGHIANITKIYGVLPNRLVDDNTAFGNGYYLGYNYTDKNWTKKSFSMTPSYTIFGITLPGNFVQQDPSKTNNCPQAVLITEEQHNISGKGIAPIGINFNTSKNAPEGDNKINFVLTYSDGKKWYQDKQEVSVHINSIWEQYYIYQIIISGVVISIIGNFLLRLFGEKENKN
jgi:hypothetical protein